jgi:phenylpropionate dioxygenase-like ring-hydroxylating dioxygenase large terminal subunit
MTANAPIDWARALTDPEEFKREQDRLGRYWTFLGLTGDVANDGDWIRATIGQRSVFVQRFGEALKGFENVCAHRFYPLRTADKGNGPVVCGYHHWRYDQEGRALGIPICQEVFGKIPRDLDARLKPIEVATCGSLIFGRIPSSASTETLESYLGEGFPILAAMSNIQGTPGYLERSIEANWKLCFEISLDDYHIVAVHPGTFGREGYITRNQISYHRFGRHSAYFFLPDKQALTKMAEECRGGSWLPIEYAVIQLFPNIEFLQFDSGGKHWFVVWIQYVPVAPGRTTMRAWYYALPKSGDWLARLTGGISDVIRRHVVGYYIGKVLGEDQAACEQLQTVASQIKEQPIFGALEERVIWFQEEYAKAMAERESGGA